MSTPTTRTRALRAGAACLLAVPLAGALTLPDTAAARIESRHGACTIQTDQQSGTSALRAVDSGGLERSYVLHLPAGYERRSDWPLVVVFHGRGSTGEEIEGFSKLSTLPAVVAYPDGVIATGDGDRQAWQGAPYEPPGVDDVAFTEDLLDELQDDTCVDARRTYATGKSNGAGLVGLLACRLPDRFAAVAPVAGAFYPGTAVGCEDASPVPILDIHGTGDATIPYAGDAERGLPAIPDWVAGWVDRDDCRARPHTTVTEPDITTTRWRGCRKGTEVAHVAVTDGGHVWPGTEVYSGGGYVTQTIEAHEVIWDFFSHHRLAGIDAEADR